MLSLNKKKEGRPPVGAGGEYLDGGEYLELEAPKEE